MFRDTFDCHNYAGEEGEGALASREQRLGMLLSILQCTGWPLQQGITQPNRSMVLRLRDRASD